MITLPLVCDQPFWAATIYNACLGPSPLQEATLNSEKLVEAFRYCLRSDVKQVASRLGLRIRGENGTINAVKSFYRQLQWERVRCSDAGTDPIIFRMQLKPPICNKIETSGPIDLAKGGESSVTLGENIVYRARDKEPDSIDGKISTSLLVNTKGVSKSLIKAIIKPTVSHIADAHKKFEAQNDLPFPASQNVEQYRSRKESAMKVARNVSFGSAVACGKIAILPFKTVWYMSETASYGVRALQGRGRQDKIHEQDEEKVLDNKDPWGFEEGKVAQEQKVKNMFFDHACLIPVIDPATFDRDDAYTRAITASRMMPAHGTQNSNVPRSQDGDAPGPEDSA
ncbi:hypothetical protein N7462_001160 [Penicillium macrosclerotiorum]|uniref:uncharacterized protein n=1 Tax=Penicillium macrosclerotiorum TaxID=303699 RepID=UPI002548D704|nr:uncharacterized protein N7462_001160 [Penicillium macrosclerotiorum]KAJ5699155.1 hypothetical protein N7462_001160 [Penicillium macrosclerotiorum]